MPAPDLNIIAACAENRVIGRAGRLPWQIPEDWNYFLTRTCGGVLVMGRISFEEMVAVGAVTGDRDFVVITRGTASGPRVRTASSWEDARERARDCRGPVWACGGQRIYEKALPVATRLFLTRVHATVEGDTFFPKWEAHFTKLVSERPGKDGLWQTTFQVWER